MARRRRTSLLLPAGGGLPAGLTPVRGPQVLGATSRY
jgi:hypothetical protein